MTDYKNLVLPKEIKMVPRWVAFQYAAFGLVGWMFSLYLIDKFC